MTFAPQDQISDFSEIDDRLLTAPVRAFSRSVGWGALAGGGFFLLLTVPLGIGLLIDGEPGGLLMAVSPLLIAGGVCLAALLAIGLPFTALLHHLQAELASTYAGIGLLGGLLIPPVAIQLAEGDWTAGLFLSIPGMLAGCVTGHVWGTWREQCAAPDDQPANRFHDLLF